MGFPSITLIWLQTLLLKSCNFSGHHSYSGITLIRYSRVTHIVFKVTSSNFRKMGKWWPQNICQNILVLCFGIFHFSGIPDSAAYLILCWNIKRWPEYVILKLQLSYLDIKLKPRWAEFLREKKHLAAILDFEWRPSWICITCSSYIYFACFSVNF